MNLSPDNAIINRSITRRLTASLIITVLIVSVIAVTAMHRVVSQAAMRSMENKADEMIAYLTGTLAIPLWSVEEETVKAIGKAASHDESIARLVIKDESGTVVYSMEKEKNGGLINRSRSIFHTQGLIEKRVGDVSVSLTPAIYNESNRRLLVFSVLIIVLILIAVAIVTIFFIRTALNRPLKSLGEITSLFASGIYDTSGQVLPYLEFQPFGRALAGMAEKIEGQISMIQEAREDLRTLNTGLELRVRERTAELMAKSAELEHKNRQLTETEQALRDHQDVLEKRVKERTASLESMNKALEEEIKERRRAEESQRRFNRELRAISDCNQVLVRAEDEETLLGEICRIICDEAGYRMAWVGYAEHDEAKTVRPVSWAGIEEGYLSIANITWADTEQGRGPCGVSIRSGTSCCIQDFASEPQAAPWRESALQRGYRSAISLPLKNEQAETFGALVIYSTEPNAFTPDEIRLMEELVGDLAFGIRALRNRNARKESERSVALLSFALNNVREAAFLIDEQARFHYVNEESCRVLGYGRDELLALGVADVDPDFPVEHWSGHWAELKSRRSLTFEGLHKARDGRVFPVEVSANYLEYDGQGYNLALVRDITDRKRAEEELQLLNSELEQRVKQRTAELEEKNAELQKLNKVFVGRELKMVELKKRIRELEKAGRE